MFRSQIWTSNWSEISNQWSLRPGAFLQEAQHLFSSAPSEKRSLITTIALQLFIFPPSLLHEPHCLLLPPHRQRRRWVSFHSICTCYPSSSTRTGCARHAPGAQWEHQDSYWRAALPCSSQHVFWLQWGLFFHLSSLSSTTKYNGSWTHKNVLAPDSLKCFVGMRTVSHPTLLITFFFFFFFYWRCLLKEKAKHTFQGENCQHEFESKSVSISMGSFTASQPLDQTQEGKQTVLAPPTLSTQPHHHQSWNTVVFQQHNFKS